MVIIAAAAVGAAAVGLYHGGKTAVNKTKKAFTERTERHQRDTKRNEEQRQREDEAAALKSISFEERLAKYKRERGLPSSSTQQKQTLTFNSQKHRQSRRQQQERR
jgi:hypothetical protein